MSSKRTTFYIDDDFAAVAKIMGVTNFSELFREMIEYLVSTSGEEMTRSQVRIKLKDFADMKRAELQKQMKISEMIRAEKEKAADIQAKRTAAIHAAIQKEITRIGRERFENRVKILQDYNYSQLDYLIQAVAQDSGYKVNYTEVIAAFKQVQAIPT